MPDNDDRFNHTAHAAEIVLHCDDLDASIVFYRQRLGFRLEMIFPADAPRVAVVTGAGLRIRLDKAAKLGAGHLRIHHADLPDDMNADVVTAPEGTRIERVSSDDRSAHCADGQPAFPEHSPEILIEPGGESIEWGEGRAGMRYRDLIPGRLGGTFIASHISIPDGGPVADYVHHHHVRFQMIFCKQGWVEVVYEDQGPPFVMQAGDCVLQPPHIRHQVLRCSAGFEAVEIGGPAEHETLVDHAMTLPIQSVDPDREFGGQQFVFHQAADALWGPSIYAGLERRDTGIAAATKGVASALVLRPEAAGGASDIEITGKTALLFRFVLKGELTLQGEGIETVRLSADAAFVIPAGVQHHISALSDDLELLEVTASV